MLKPTDIIMMSVKGLVQHRLRTLLSALGIIFGVAAVISMMAVGEGARRAALEQIRLLGTNNIRITQLPLTGEERQKAGLRYARGLTFEDALLLRQSLPAQSVTIAPLKVIPAEVRFKDRRGTADIIGTSAEYAEVTGFRVERGRFLSLPDLAETKTVCVLGSEIKQELFGPGDAVDAALRIGDAWFTVVGIMEPKEIYKGKNPVLKLRNVNRDVYIPVTTSLRRFPRPAGGPSGIDEIALKAAREEQMPDIVRLARAALDRSHRGVRDYEILVPEELLAQARKTQRLFNIVIGSIAGISLLVGGIGIMNIMLANVSERTREIGIRRAIGARRRDILLQFLTESVLVCLSGGLIGVFLGFAMARIITLYAEWETAFSLAGVVAAFGTAAFVGIVFGLFPAGRAAKLDPVEALRM
jgi:putative ABC transport system permease protein